MLGKEKFESVDEAIETYLSWYLDVGKLTDIEYAMIFDELCERNSIVWKEMPVDEIYYDVEAFVEGYLYGKNFLVHMQNYLRKDTN